MDKVVIFEPFLKRLRVSTEIDAEDESAIRSLPVAEKRMGAEKG
ncbi:cAMPbinding proteins catabolite gene activator and regulatory subunit of cAMPdependent protein kinases [Bradyrhizobium sp.]|nr:hypothetical protein [Bradyrhizobium sp.]CUT12738.1 cAMPbinding proteins catabolite gene activator and regulatory subunit of cAMPdependent protein kinases [Bradyrhizobium sp.]